jgi:hypothetical protein
MTFEKKLFKLEQTHIMQDGRYQYDDDDAQGFDEVVCESPVGSSCDDGNKVQKRPYR